MKQLLILTIFSAPIFASEFNADTYSASLNFAQVEKVLATQKSDGTWCFGTSVKHNDQGWKHYADAWEVLDLNGNQLGHRKLHHPHDNEQPFTRSQCNIKIPATTSKVLVRAKCNKHGFGGKKVLVDLNAIQGKGYIARRNN